MRTTRLMPLLGSIAERNKRAFVREIGGARTVAGLHDRCSNQAAFEMGRAIGELSVRRFGMP